jgi:hypothetical protein
VSVLFELHALNGDLLGSLNKVLQIAPFQTAMMVSEMPGLPPPPFQGVLRVSFVGGYRLGNSQGAVIGIRARYNERREIVLSTASPVPENNRTTGSSELLFPHFAVGDGYQTQFMLFAGNGYPSTGTMYFLDQSGNPLTLPMQ